MIVYNTSDGPTGARKQARVSLNPLVSASHRLTRATFGLLQPDVQTKILLNPG